MHSFTKTSSAVMTIFLLFFVLQQSFSQAKLVQTFIEQNITDGDSKFGYSISGAGDVNNDGFADIIVGAVRYDSSRGRAYIYYGGNPMDSTADLILTGGNIGDNFGCSVSGAGDVNNDGFDDVIVGAFNYDSTGRAYIYYGGNPMDSNADLTMTGAGVNNYFGASVSRAGDVNNDTYDDIIIGAYGYNSNRGRAYIYYGGNPMNDTADVILRGEGAGNNFGCSVADAGDLNNDGYGDVIIGAYAYDSNRGRAYIYYGGNPMNDTADVTMTGGDIGVCFGSSVSGAGDVNNNGYDDVIVGAYADNAVIGSAYIYYGGNPMNNVYDVKLDGEGTGGTDSRFGYSVSDAGDVNDDNYNDVIVGSYGYNSNTGRAYIYYGGNPMNANPDVKLNGENISNCFGVSVSGSGDINNDGYDDVIAGAHAFGSHTGRAYIYYGNNPTDTIADVIITGEGKHNYFGRYVSSAGDVNNDGYEDIIVGADRFYDFTGRVYIYYGGNPMDPTADVIMTGEGISNYFGAAISGAGDVNNDGFDDVIVSARGFNSGRGRVYIYFGSNQMNSTADLIITGVITDTVLGYSVSGAGDVNNDGYNDVIITAYPYYTTHKGSARIYYGGNPMNNIADVTMAGEGTDKAFGNSVSNAGDVNNDGYDDVIAGASEYNSGIGRAYIYYGGNPMDSTADVIMNGEESNINLGGSVSNAGDVNNDSYDDVIVGAAGYNSYTGRAYIYYGNNQMDSTADVILTGEGISNYFGHSVSGAGDVNKDNYDDVIVGADGYNSSTGRAYVYYGGSPMDSTADLTFTGEGIDNVFACSVSDAGDVNNDGYDDVIIGAFNNSLNGKAYIYSDPGSPVSVKTTISLNPDKFELLQNYPNPFNPSTTIEFSVGTYSHTSLRIYDIIGREVVTLVNGQMKPGVLHKVQFNASQLPSGIYFSCLESDGKILTKKLLLIK